MVGADEFILMCFQLVSWGMSVLLEFIVFRTEV